MEWKGFYALSRVKFSQIFKIMRVFTICMLVFVFGATASGFSQKQVVTLDLRQCDMSTLFQEIWKQTGLRFVYNDKDVASISRFDVKAESETVEKVLEEVFAKTSLTCTFEGDVILVVVDKQRAIAADPVKKVTVKGRVTDETKSPLPGVTVVVKIPGATANTIGTSTDVNGKYELSWVDQKNVSLVFSFVGMETQEVAYTNQKEIDVVMKEETKALEDVVITGYFQRKKVSQTGSEVVVEGEELRKVGSLNLLQAISAFDPGVRTLENNEFGSDPNRMPEITVRGQKGFDLRSEADDSRTDPNAPLYIMDGIEVSAQTVYDMDMNRIAAFSILKDASATSLYGSRGANGVILITTVRPQAGEIKVTLNGNFNISIPDLRSYNLMEAREKLEYERLAGVYKANSYDEQAQKDIMYNDVLMEIERGVNTYWLSQPLRTSVNQRYSAFLEGGDEHFRYGVNLKYDNDKGVMKKSGREKYGINVYFSYDIAGKLIARNDVIIDDVKATNSPYGAFYQYAQMNPYERIYDAETGEMIREFDANGTVVRNVLVNSLLPNFSYEKYTQIRDNFQLQWWANSHLMFRGNIAITKQTDRNEAYLSPESVEFEGKTDASEKGSYTISNGNSVDLEGSLTVNYNNNFFDKLYFSLGLGTELQTSKSTDDGYVATGFLNDKLIYPSYALQFQKNSKPTGYFDKSRLVGFFGNANMNWDNRYILDVTYRTDGSSRFGRKSRFAPFWSVGAAWNINQENFWTGSGYMKLRASVGSTGSTNFSADQALTRFTYNSDNEYNGIYGAVVNAYGNPALKWQNVLKYNVGLDMSVWRNIITLNFDAYLERTENLLLNIDVAPSTGFTSYTENMGSLDNKGFEARLRLNLINDRQNDLSWNVTLSAAHEENKIRKLSNAMKAMNQEAMDIENNKGGSEVFRMYEVGRSQTALMLVRSMGIDPATGNEVYIKRDGSLTFEYDPNDKVEVGNTNPKLQGFFNSNLTWKGLNLYMNFGYEMGAKQFNQTLATKVEGADPKKNADRRVLYDRWKKPGDKAMFRRIDDQTPVYQSTRLVQKSNFLKLSSLSLTYDIPRDMLKKTFIERCKFTFSMTDVFRISTIKEERGTSYPFARTVSLGFNLTF